MNGYEIKFEGTLYINANNENECETYLSEILKQAGFFNVKAEAQETFKWVEYAFRNSIYEHYEVEWKQTNNPNKKEGK